MHVAWAAYSDLTISRHGLDEPQKCGKDFYRTETGSLVEFPRSLVVWVGMRGRERLHCEELKSLPAAELQRLVDQGATDPLPMESTFDAHDVNFCGKGSVPLEREKTCEHTLVVASKHGRLRRGGNVSGFGVSNAEPLRKVV